VRDELTDNDLGVFVHESCFRLARRFPGRRVADVSVRATHLREVPETFEDRRERPGTVAAAGENDVDDRRTDSDLRGEGEVSLDVGKVGVGLLAFGKRSDGELEVTRNARLEGSLWEKGVRCGLVHAM
jgi:hypothetical protein